MTFHYSLRLLKDTSYKLIDCQIIQIKYIVYQNSFTGGQGGLKGGNINRAEVEKLSS